MRSGDHDGFTRLVLSFSDRPTWSLGQNNGDAILRLGGAPRQFDFSGAFEMISRSRLQALYAEPGGRDVRLQLACDCSVDVTELGTRFLVVDIRDTPPIQPLPTVTLNKASIPSAPSVNTAPHRNIRLSNRISRPSPQILVAPDDTPARSERAMPLDQTAFAEALALAQPLAELSGVDVRNPIRPQPEQTRALDLDVATEPSFSGLTNRLAEQIGRAASQGLIEGAGPGGGVVRDIDPEVAAAAAAENIRIRSAIDEALGTLADERPVSDDGLRCLPDHALAINVWGPPEDQPGQIADVRARLITELGDTDLAVVRQLIRRYLYLSFGTEAQALLAQFGAEIPDADLLGVMATLVNGDPVSDPGPLRGQAACDGAAALWSFLADPSQDNSLNATSVARVFSGLPLHLRRHLGQPIAEALIARGEDDAARSVRNAISRAPGDHGVGLEMVNASLAADEGAPKAQAMLAEIAASGQSEAPVAMLRYLNAAHEDGRRVAPAMIELAETMAFERRGLPEALDLKRAELAARIDLQAFDETAAALFRTDGQQDLPSADLKALWASYLSTLSTESEDAEFLRIGFQPRIWAEALVTDDRARRALVSRLMALGFWREAEALTVGADADADWVALTGARIALAAGRPREALVALVAQEGPEADALRAEALSRSRAFIEASRVFEAKGDTEAGATMAWRAGEFQRAAALGGDTRPDVAHIMAPPVPILSEDAPTGEPTAGERELATGRGLIAESAGVRAEITDILTKFPPPLRRQN